MSEKNTLVYVLAGGGGTRLRPLTDPRAKPAVPFAGKYRIVDDVMSKLFYTDVSHIRVIPQYQYRSLNNHLQDAWVPRTSPKQTIRTLPPRQRNDGQGWYLGTADAINQNMEEIYDAAPDHVGIFAADHICTLDISDMIAAHHSGKRDLTIAAEKRKVKESDFEPGKDRKLRYKYGIIEVDKNYKVTGFREKPVPEDMPKIGEEILVSMGNYIFETEPLVVALAAGYGLDFGNHVLPGMKQAGARMFVYPFSGYWRDVGDVRSYYETSLDLLVENPPLDLYQMKKDKRPMLTLGTDYTPTRDSSHGKDSLFSEGCEFQSGVTLEGCIISPAVSIGRGSLVRNSIIFNNSVIGPGCIIRNAIIDKQNRIPAGSQIGNGSQGDSRFTQVPIAGDQKLVVVPKGFFK